MEKKLEKAIEIAKKYHEGQMRKDNTPYINHPLAVMQLLKDRNFPEEALIAAVLHDICEDTKISNININEIFGSRVSFIVNALSKNKKPKNNKYLKAEYKRKQKEKKVSNLENYDNYDEYIDYRFHMYLNRLYTGIMADPRIFFIKISDQIHNLSDMAPFPMEKKLRKIKETEEYFLPIYEKTISFFSIDLKTLNEYNYFIELLKYTLKKAYNKNNIKI